MEIVLSSITQNNELEIESLDSLLVINDTNKTHVYVGISATSLNHVTLSFDDLYNDYIECNLERFLKQENMYAVHIEIQDFYYLPGKQQYRDIFFSLSAQSNSSVSNSSSFTIKQNGCKIEWPLTFKSISGASQIGLASVGVGQRVIEFSRDKIRWYKFNTNVIIPIDEGEEVYVRGVVGGSYSVVYHTQFSIDGNVLVSGNLNSLWDYNDFTKPLIPYCGHSLFKDCTGLTDASELIFGLEETTLATSCYSSMFSGCTNLLMAPRILPAMELKTNCYFHMFDKCTSLKVAPILPAETLVGGCYTYMFSNCSSLIYIKCLAIYGICGNSITTDCGTPGWVNGVNTGSLGEFVMNSSMSAQLWGRGQHGIPSRWRTSSDN